MEPIRAGTAGHTRRAGAPWLLYACVLLIVAAIAVAEAGVLFALKDMTLRQSAGQLETFGRAFSEEADRALLGLDRALGDLVERMETEAGSDAATLAAHMGQFGLQRTLRERLSGLPHVLAIGLLDANGRVVNWSRNGPPSGAATPGAGAPTGHALGGTSERDYVRLLQADPARRTAVGEPIPTRDEGGWGLPIAHRIRTGQNELGGIAVGTVDLRHFESLFHAMAPPGAMRLILQRDDGVALLLHHTGTDAEDATADVWAAADGAVGGAIVSRRPLPDFPLSVTVSQSRTAALQPWRASLPIVVLGGGLLALLLGGAVLATGRRWQTEEDGILRRAEAAESERDAAAEAAEQARQRERQAEAASRQRSGFLAMMSHEIRTPMNAVLGLAGTLLDAPLPPQQRSVVSAIRESGDSLLRLLNDILDFSKLDAGRMTLEAAPFSPQLVTHNPVSILGPRAAAKGLTIDANCAEGVPPALLGDAGRIRQVLLNLVSNAVKFTEHGGVRIEARCTGRTETQATVTWTVADTGIGIPPDRIDRLFDDFVQADSSITRRFGGTGLGLAISKRLIDQMGGMIAVSSDPGRGTTFAVTLTLPLATLAPAASPVPTDAARLFLARVASLGRPLRMLFAEDNPTNQLVALHLLKGFPVQVDVVADGLEAVDAAGTFLYDVICMDVRMPEMDGLQATRLIRRRGGRLANVPIIALTANAFPEDVKDCFDAGMTGFVSKPVTRETLLTALVQALAGSEEAPGGGTATVTPAGCAAAAAPTGSATGAATRMPAAAAGQAVTTMPIASASGAVTYLPAASAGASAPVNARDRHTPAGAGVPQISSSAGAGEPPNVPFGDMIGADPGADGGLPHDARAGAVHTGIGDDAGAMVGPLAAHARQREAVALDRTAAATLAEDVGEDGRAEMFALFTAETEARIGRLASGRLDPATLLREVHSLKGAAATVCAPRLARRAEALEARLRGNGAVGPTDIAGLSTDFAAWRDAGKPLLTPGARAL